MSSTRHAETDGPMRQNRFASSAEFERGILGNLVARRVEVFASAAHRELVWWLQSMSWQAGGLAKLTADLVATFPNRIATDSMQKFGTKPGQIYNAEQVRGVRKELFGIQSQSRGEIKFPLKGETKKIYAFHEDDDYCGRLQHSANLKEAKQAAENLPNAYPVKLFLDVCLEKAAGLGKLLQEICLNPAINIGEFRPVYFPTLIETLLEYQSARIENKRACQVITQLGRQVYETLDYCLKTRCMVVIDGLARTGKTFSTKAWCDLHPGEARYVQTPSSADDKGFFRAIARSLGVAAGDALKAQQIRDRIEDTLHHGNLAVVFDEAHYMWPGGRCRDVLPGRVNWIMTALVNAGVPVALVTTPQFMRSQKTFEEQSRWASEQFIGRIGHYEKLPECLSEADLTAVARAILPDGCDKSIKLLAAYAEGSAKYLAGIEAVARRAKYLAAKSDHQQVTLMDVKAAISEGVVPSDQALQQALAGPAKSARRRAVALPQRGGSIAAAPMPPRAQEAAMTPATRPGNLTAYPPLALDPSRQSQEAV